jgi:hypothetical protein
VLGVRLFAEFETNLRRERQMEGIAAAKARGVYKGRPKSIDVAEIKKLLGEGVGASDVAERLGIGRASVDSATILIELRTSMPPVRRQCRGNSALRQAPAANARRSWHERIRPDCDKTFSLWNVYPTGR